LGAILFVFGLISTTYRPSKDWAYRKFIQEGVIDPGAARRLLPGGWVGPSALASFLYARRDPAIISSLAAYSRHRFAARSKPVWG